MSKTLFALLAGLALATCLAVAQDQLAQSPSGQTQPAPQAQPPSQPQQQIPAAQGQTGMSSKDLEAAMTSAFQRYPELSDVKVRVTDDKIELSGTVPSQADKDKARRAAEANADRRKVVDDDLKVGGGGESKPPAEKPPMSEKPPIPPR